jgi:hypothetical protein
MLLKYVVCVLVALALHLTLGWLATILAGVVAGAWFIRKGWLWGGAVGVADWAILVAYNFIVASGPVSRMTAAVGGILGNLPGWAVVAVTLLIGAVLGMAGGYLGASLRLLVESRKAHVTA